MTRRSDPLAPSDPSTLGPYRLLGLLGRGGMGAVYLGEHATLGATRAIKVLGAMETEQRQQRFARELEHLARVRHPNVITIHDSGWDDRRAWFAMDVVRGDDLAGVVAGEGPLAWQRAARILAGVAAGVAALHAEGVIHRDLKPANVMLRPDGIPVVLDLGLAVAPEHDQRLTKTGAIVGTPTYMAPEQVRGEQATPATDVHGLGLILFELLCGEPAVQGDSIHQLLAQILSEQVPAPSTLVPNVPPELDAVCAKALSKNPAERFVDAGELALALKPICEGRVSAHRGPRAPLIASVAGLLAALGIAAITGTGWAPREPQHAADVLDREAPATAPLPALTPEQISAGTRAARKLGHIADRAERIDAATGWLETYAPSHPKAPQVQARLAEDRLHLPARTIPKARYVSWLDEQRFATWSRTDPETVAVWSVASHDPLVRSAAPGKVVRVADHPSGSGYVVAMDRGNTQHLGADGRWLGSIPRGRPGTLSPDGLTRARVLGDNGPLELRREDTGELVWKTPIAPLSQLRQVAFSPSGTHLVAAGGGSFTLIDAPAVAGSVGLMVVDAKTGAVLHREQMPGSRPNFVTFPRSGLTFAVGTVAGSLFLKDAGSGSTLREFRHEESGGASWSHVFGAMTSPIRGGALSPDGSLLYTASGNLDDDVGAFSVWDPASGERLRHVGGLKAFLTLRLSPQGGWVGLSCNSGDVLIWHAR